MNAHTIKMPPYGVLNVTEGKSIAFLSGNAPWIIIRTGSDAFRLPVGHCYPVEANYVAICNPFPRPIEITVARGLPPHYGPDSDISAPAHMVNVHSTLHVYRVQVDTPLKFAVGVMPKKGRVNVTLMDGHNDDKSQVMIFRGARPDFITFKPAGAWQTVNDFRFADGTADTTLNAISGTYAPEDVTAWVTNSGYKGEVVVLASTSLGNRLASYELDETSALFFVRKESFQGSVFMKVQHLGLGVEAYS